MRQEEGGLVEDDGDDRIVGDSDSRAGILSPFKQRRRTGAASAFQAEDTAWTWKSSRRHGSADLDERYWDNHGLLWCAFSFAIGIALYRLIPEEPDWRVLLAVLIAGCLIALRIWRQGTPVRSLTLALLLLGGMTSAALRTATVDAPRLGEAMNVTVTGHVLEQEIRSSRRVLLAVTSVDTLPVDGLNFPQIIRVRLPADSTIKVGDHIKVQARLFPPAGPVSPGGYDFSYRAYYALIGATGFSFGSPVTVDGPEAGWPADFGAWVDTVRADLADLIRATLQSRPEAGLAVALLVGDRSGISETQEEHLRAAGLAHILAISGLHMALFAGGAYWATLLVLALVPGLTSRSPIHKWAAAIAFLAAVAYLLLSGASVATQRSFFMIALVFLGVFVGRRALTLRSVALAGFVLLLLAPERLFHPGFQMSFAAVICLVAVYETWRRWKEESLGQGWLSRDLNRTWLQRIMAGTGRWVGGLLVTAFVAGLATGIIGAHHFGRVAPFGLLGNTLGMPVFSLLVMPMGVMALVLMPLGLSFLPLTIMSFGLWLLMKIATFTATIGDGTGTIGNVGALATILLMAALFASLLLPGRFRIFAGLPFLAGATLAMLERPPDIQIADAGNRVAARDDLGTLRLFSARKSFVSEIWLQREGVPGSAIKSRKMKSGQRRCDEAGCVIHAHVSSRGLNDDFDRPYRVALPRSPEAFYQDCQYADLIVSDLIAPTDCDAALVLDKEVRANRGAVSIWLATGHTVSSGPTASSSRQLHGPGAETEASEAKDLAGDKLAPGSTSAATGGARIDRVVFAIPDPPRPWHAPGTVTRASLRRAAKDQKTADWDHNNK